MRGSKAEIGIRPNKNRGKNGGKNGELEGDRGRK